MENENAIDFSSSKSFIMIPTGACYNKKLIDKSKALILLGQIVSMLNVTGSFYASNKEMAKRLNCTPRTVQTYLDLLEDEDLIERKIERNKQGEVVKRRISAGKKLASAFSFGWKTKDTKESTSLLSEIGNTPRETDNTTPHEKSSTTPRETDNTTLTKHVSYKENNLIDHINKTDTNKQSKSYDKKLAAEFEEVWQEYPKKLGKKEALKHYIAWRKESKNNTNKFLLEKISDYKNYIQANHIEFRYIKYGSTWFNGGYDDDYKTGGTNNGKISQSAFGYDELLDTPPNNNFANDYSNYN